jgi:hypothetical protein
MDPGTNLCPHPIPRLSLPHRSLLSIPAMDTPIDHIPRHFPQVGGAANHYSHEGPPAPWGRVQTTPNPPGPVSPTSY